MNEISELLFGFETSNPNIPLGYSRLPHSERNLAYKPLMRWTDLDRAYEANRKILEALGRHSEMNYMKNRE